METQNMQLPVAEPYHELVKRGTFPLAPWFRPPLVDKQSWESLPESIYEEEPEPPAEPQRWRPPLTPLQLSKSLAHINLQCFGSELQIAANAAFPNNGGMRYSNVYVLMLSWEDEDPMLPVSVEIEALRRVFEQDYGFECREWKIPTQGSHKKLNQQILDFVEFGDDSRDDLKIVYYGGHGMLAKNRQPCWASRHSIADRSYSSVKWSGIQNALEEASSDMLLLLDCCSSGTASTDSGKGVTELIAACSFNGIANDVGDYSFTTALIQELKALANGPLFTIGHLFTEILTRIQLRIPDGFENRKSPSPIHVVLSQDQRLPRAIQLCGQRSQGTYSRPPMNIPINSNSHAKSQHIVAWQDDVENSRNQKNYLQNPSFLSLPSLSLATSTSPSESGNEESSPPSFSPSLPASSDFLERYPRIALSIRLSESLSTASMTSSASMDLLTDWLRMFPILAEHVRVEAGFASFSTLLVVSVPADMWCYASHSDAVTCLGWVQGGNFVKEGGLDLSGKGGEEGEAVVDVNLGEGEGEGKGKEVEIKMKLEEEITTSEITLNTKWKGKERETIQLCPPEDEDECCTEKPHPDYNSNPSDCSSESEPSSASSSEWQTEPEAPEISPSTLDLESINTMRDVIDKLHLYRDLMHGVNEGRKADGVGTLMDLLERIREGDRHKLEEREGEIRRLVEENRGLGEVVQRLEHRVGAVEGERDGFEREVRALREEREVGFFLPLGLGCVGGVDEIVNALREHRSSLPTPDPNSSSDPNNKVKDVETTAIKLLEESLRKIHEEDKSLFGDERQVLKSLVGERDSKIAELEDDKRKNEWDLSLLRSRVKGLKEENQLLISDKMKLMDKKENGGFKIDTTNLRTVDDVISSLRTCQDSLTTDESTDEGKAEGIRKLTQTLTSIYQREKVETKDRIENIKMESEEARQLEAQYLQHIRGKRQEALDEIRRLKEEREDSILLPVEIGAGGGSLEGFITELRRFREREVEREAKRKGERDGNGDSEMGIPMSEKVGVLVERLEVVCERGKERLREVEREVEGLKEERDRMVSEGGDREVGVDGEARERINKGKGVDDRDQGVGAGEQSNVVKVEGIQSREKPPNEEPTLARTPAPPPKPMDVNTLTNIPTLIASLNAYQSSLPASQSAPIRMLTDTLNTLYETSKAQMVQLDEKQKIINQLEEDKEDNQIHANRLRDIYTGVRKQVRDLEEGKLRDEERIRELEDRIERLQEGGDGGNGEL